LLGGEIWRWELVYLVVLADKILGYVALPIRHIQFKAGEEERSQEISWERKLHLKNMLRSQFRCSGRSRADAAQYRTGWRQVSDLWLML